MGQIGENGCLKFFYVNWRGEEHEYVIEPESLEYRRLDYDDTHHWVLNGTLVTRDGDPRADMGVRRRTFVVAKMQLVREIDRSA